MKCLKFSVSGKFNRSCIHEKPTTESRFAMSLQLIQVDCGRLLEQLKSLSARSKSAADPELHQKISDAIAAVSVLLREAQQPVRVGLVGAFNAGKTRLLEALLGCAGRLNVIDKPATGNLVEFDLKVGPVNETQLSGWKISFMSEVQDAGRILRRLLTEARDLQNREVTQNPAGADLNRALYEAEFGEGQRPPWIKALEWAKQAHAKARANQFKAVAFEVYRLAYTVGQATEWLGREFSVKEPDAVALMSLDYDPQEVYSQDLAQWRVQVPDVPRNGAIDGVTAKELKALFPVVRKIVVNATLPTLIAAPLGEVGLDVRMVDCPGAGADGTNFRDGILCAQELKDVDTVFALLNAKNPGENRQFIDELLRIWGQQAKDRILAIASRFDELPHDKNVSAGKRDELADGSGPLSTQELMKAIPTFDTIYKAAMHTVMDRDPERIAFVSTMGYLSERLQEEHRGLRGLEKEFYLKELGFPPAQPRPGLPAWDQTHQPWVSEMGGWNGVAERLAQDAAPESKALARLLSDFASDGGFTRLHRILQKHLSQFGQANKLGRLSPRHAQLKSLVAELQVEVDRRKDTEGPATVPPAEETVLSPIEAIHQVSRVYQSFVTHSESEARHYPLVYRLAGSLDARPMLPPLRRGLIADIMRWDEWRLLFSRIGRTAPGLVEFVDADDPALKNREADLNDERKTPVKSDDFMKPFLQSMAKLRNALRDRCLDGLKHHGEELRRDLEGRLGGSASVDRLRDAFTRDGGIGVDPYANVAEALATSWMDPILPDVAASTEAGHRAGYIDYFPLQHGAGKPLSYAWYKRLHEKHSRQFDDRHRHLMYVVKLRQVIIDSALAWLDDVGYELEQSLRTAILERLRKLRNDLKAEAEKRPLVERDDTYAD